MGELNADRMNSGRLDTELLPSDFDVVAWTRQACQASGVPFAVEDPVVLGRLCALMEHPA